MQVELLEYTEQIKMNNPTIRIHDTSTDKVLDREMTDVEFAQYEADKTTQAQTDAKADAAKAAALGKLAALGLTTDDLKALGL